MAFVIAAVAAGAVLGITSVGYYLGGTASDSIPDVPVLHNPDFLASSVSVKHPQPQQNSPDTAMPIVGQAQLLLAIKQLRTAPATPKLQSATAATETLYQITKQRLRPVKFAAVTG